MTKLAARCGFSRTTLLYYESIGLVPTPRRSRGNYRCYEERDFQRLLQIRAYRDAGLRLADIRTILDCEGGDVFGVLKKRLLELDAEISTLRSHQKAILQLLQQKTLRKANMITKEKWIAIMHASGFNKKQMNSWHAEFERSAPDEHQEFLEFLHISAEEIKNIREQSRSGARRSNS